MSGARHRRKGNRAERALVVYLQGRGFAAERVPLSGSAGGSFTGDVSVPLIGRDLRTEVKVRRNGFNQLYRWLAGRDLLVVSADHREPLVIVPLRLAADIAAAAEARKSETLMPQSGPPRMSALQAALHWAEMTLPKGASQAERLEAIRRVAPSLNLDLGADPKETVPAK